MNIVIVDDELLSIKNLELTIKQCTKGNLVYCFNNPYLVIDFISSHEVDLAFLDIEMAGMKGIDLAKELKKINKNLQICFVTGYDNYAYDAFKVEAIGYLLKPYNDEDVVKIIEKVEKLNNKVCSKVFIRTFGNFDVYVDGKLLYFSSKKAKEMLAILVDHRGSYLTSNEIIGILFEEKEVTENLKSYYRNIRVCLNETLKKENIENIITLSKGGCNLNANLVDCDYFQLLKEHNPVNTRFFGEYMNNYSWAEDTLGYLLNNF